MPSQAFCMTFFSSSKSSFVALPKNRSVRWIWSRSVQRTEPSGTTPCNSVCTFCRLSLMASGTRMATKRRRWSDMGHSRQPLAAGGDKQPVPFFTGQFYFCCLSQFAYSLGISRSNDRHHLARMFQKPGQRNHGAGCSFLSRNFVEGWKEPRGLVIFLRRQQATCSGPDETASQRTPGHWNHFFEQALVQRAVRKRAEVRQTHFDLMCDERHWTSRFQRGHQRRAKVADAEITNFACSLEFRKCLGDLRRITEKVRPMQKIDINGIQAQPAQRL